MRKGLMNVVYLIVIGCPGGVSTLGHGQWGGARWMQVPAMAGTQETLGGAEAERSPSEGCLPSSFIQHGRGIIIMDFCSPPRAAARLREQKGTKTFPQTCCPGSDL